MDRFDRSITDSQVGGSQPSVTGRSSPSRPCPAGCAPATHAPGSSWESAFRSLAATSLSTDSLPKAIMVSSPTGAHPRHASPPTSHAALAGLGVQRGSSSGPFPARSGTRRTTVDRRVRRSRRRATNDEEAEPRTADRASSRAARPSQLRPRPERPAHGRVQPGRRHGRPPVLGTNRRERERRGRDPTQAPTRARTTGGAETARRTGCPAAVVDRSRRTRELVEPAGRPAAPRWRPSTYRTCTSSHPARTASSPSTASRRFSTHCHGRASTPWSSAGRRSSRTRTPRSSPGRPATCCGQSRWATSTPATRNSRRIASTSQVSVRSASRS